MSAIDTDIAFATMMARAARAHGLDAGPLEADGPGTSRPWVIRFYMTSIVSTLAILSAVTVFAGCSALASDQPMIWIHRLMAISLAQSILFAAMVVKLAPMATFARQTTRIAIPEPFPLLEQARAAAVPPPPHPQPRPERPSLVGHGVLAGRDYAEYSDGSVEINTMLGRRRFISLDTARSFVGA